MESNFAFEVAETALALRRDFDRRAAGHGVTRAQWRVLARLGGGDAVRQVELAEALDVVPITLSRMIDRLSEAGLVERRRDDEDRRAQRIHLTPDAASVITGLCVIAAEILDDGLDGISVEEQALVLKVLGRVRSNIASAGARRVS